MSTRVWLECSVKLGFFNYSLFSNCSSFSLLQGSNLQNIKTKISSPPIGHFVLIRGFTQMIRLPIGRRGGGTPRVLSWDSDHCLGTPRVLSWDSDHCLQHTMQRKCRHNSDLSLEIHKDKDKNVKKVSLMTLRIFNCSSTFMQMKSKVVHYL